jgi:hypothetical protein
LQVGECTMLLAPPLALRGEYRVLLNPLGGVEIPNLGWAWPERDREAGMSDEDGAKASARELSERIAAANSRAERILLS